MNFPVMCRCASFLVMEENIFGVTYIHFGVTYVLRVQYKMARRNRYLEGMEDGQMTPCGYPNFNSYIKNLGFLVFRTDGQRDGRTDRQTDGDIDPGRGGWVT
jgi:hypothetical protein